MMALHNAWALFAMCHAMQVSLLGTIFHHIREHACPVRSTQDFLTMSFTFTCKEQPCSLDRPDEVLGRELQAFDSLQMTVGKNVRSGKGWDF